MGLQGVCIDTGNSTNLQHNNTYFLFPHGGQAYHVSRFPHEGSHFGTYQKKRFRIVETQKDWPLEPVKPSKQLTLEVGKVYKAELIWRTKGCSVNTQLGTYFIAAITNSYACTTDCYFYLDAALQQPKGRYPLHWFADIQEYDEKAIKELPQSQWSQMDLFSI